MAKLLALATEIRPPATQIVGRESQVVGRESQIASAVSQIVGRDSKTVRVVSQILGRDSRIVSAVSQILGRDPHIVVRRASILGFGLKLHDRGAKILPFGTEVAIGETQTLFVARYDCARMTRQVTPAGKKDSKMSEIVGALSDGAVPSAREIGERAKEHGQSAEIPRGPPKGRAEEVRKVASRDSGRSRPGKGARRQAHEPPRRATERAADRLV